MTDDRGFTLAGQLSQVHHIALNVQDMQTSCRFYGEVLGLHALQGDEIPETLKELVAQGKVANFRLPNGLILDLFWEPDLTPPNPDPSQQFTRTSHIAFDIAPEWFDQAVEVLKQHQVPIDHGPVSRPTGRGIYFYDPDGLMLEIRCDRIAELFHITTESAWQQAQTEGIYRADSLQSEGFIHCSIAKQVAWVANQFYVGCPELIVLGINPDRLTSPWRFDLVPEVGPFPHVYGEINLDVVTRVIPLEPSIEGVFTSVNF